MIYFCLNFGEFYLTHLSAAHAVFSLREFHMNFQVLKFMAYIKYINTSEALCHVIINFKSGHELTKKSDPDKTLNWIKRAVRMCRWRLPGEICG